MKMAGSLRRGSDRSAAEAELRAIDTRNTPAGQGRSQLDLTNGSRWQAMPFGIVGMAAVVLGFPILVLVAACVNAATLLLPHTMSRQGELAIRMALGMTPAAAIRMQIAEASILVSFAAMISLLAVYTLPPVVTRLFGAEAWVGAEPFKPDWAVFFGLASCGLLAAMISSVPNVLNCRRLQITVSLGPSRDSGSKVSAFRRGVLAGIQVCMSAVLLVTAVALLQLFSQSSSPGMDTSQLFIADLTGNETGPATLQDAATLV
ncbi:MAG: hypothetical protein WCG92_20215, partial [Hyphomicrobiales bacterium]